ncbi:alpha/beta hydrolase [Tumidithrix helvetica PCC 7403]|uniref:alpha/beta fold hydrolase n=1 Tax=Tumidithrix helvetica TaxID=3457545 RepID=UPI003CA267E9
MLKQQIHLKEYTAAYLEQGEGFPIIFLHGFLGESSNWLPLMASLQAQAPSKFWYIALDLLGFGSSSKPRLKYVVDNQVDFFTEFITAMGIEKFALVGHSYGGWVTAAYAIAHASEASTFLENITLIAPAGIRDDSFVGRYQHLRPLLWDTKLVDLVLAAIAPIANLVGKQKQFATVQMARRELMQQPVARSFLVDRWRPEDAIDTVETKIHKINVPTLVIAGQQDDTIPLWHCQTYAERIPKAKLEVFSEAGHDLIQTHREAIAQLLAAHYSGL